MAVASSQLTVNATATKIPGAFSTGTTILGIFVPSGATQAIYLGGPTVTSTNGFPLAAGSTTWFTKDTTTNSAAVGWYLIAAASTQSVNIITGT